MKESIIEQILLHLYDSIDYGFSYRAKKRLYIDKFFYSSNPGFNRKKLLKGLADLKKSNFIIQKENGNGYVSISLSDKGKLRALNFRFRRLNSGKEKIWDGKWRMVFFNIPENRRRGRDALRYRLKTAGFYKLQESIFIFPYECEKEVRDFIKLFKMEKYIKFGLLDFVDGGQHIAELFKLK